MKKMIVCGDSFLSPTVSFPKKHFSEIFADRLGFDLLAYSSSGMSNGGIVLQLESAIKEKPDLIIFGTTSFDRLEIPLKFGTSDFTEDYSETLGRFKKYDMTNLLYTQATGLSTNCSYTNKNPKICSMSITSLLRPFFYNELPNDPYLNHASLVNWHMIQDFKEKQTLLKDYLYYFYDERWKMQSDMYLIQAILHKLVRSKIPFMWVWDFLFAKDPTEVDWIDDKSDVRHIMEKEIDIDFRIRSDEFKDPGFHTSFDTQENIADKLIDHYKKYFL